MASAYVTGWRGFLGFRVATLLAAEGWQVDGCDLNVYGARDGVDVRTVARPDVDVVVHCAAIARSTWPEQREMWTNNVQATRHVLSWGLPTIHCSSSVVPWWEYSCYAHSKMISEHWALAAGATCLRFGNIWGDGQNTEGHGPNVIAAFRKQIVETGHITVDGYGFQSRDFVHVDDAARAVLAAIEHPWPDEPIDICTGRQTTIISIANQFNVRLVHGPARAGDPMHIIQDPEPALKLLGWKAETVGVRL